MMYFHMYMLTDMWDYFLLPLGPFELHRCYTLTVLYQSMGPWDPLSTPDPQTQIWPIMSSFVWL